MSRYRPDSLEFKCLIRRLALPQAGSLVVFLFGVAPERNAAYHRKDGPHSMPNGQMSTRLSAEVAKMICMCIAHFSTQGKVAI